MKSAINHGHVVNLLNELTALDPQAMHAMVNMRTLCNGRLAGHKTVKVQQHKNKIDFEVGVLGILNGVFGIIHRGKNKGRGPITALFDDQTGRLTGFVSTTTL